MTPAAPDVIVLRGAPGVGKSRAAKLLAARLGAGARVEVDTLRAMLVRVDWTNQAQHVGALSVATGVVAGILRLEQRPVIVVDTFSGDKLVGFLAELRERRPGVDVRLFALVATPTVLRERVASRPSDGFKDLRICERLNAELVGQLQPGEVLIDNSSLSPEETVSAILRAIGDAAGASAAG